MVAMRGFVRPAPGADRPTDWRDRAACRDADPELFFGLSPHGPDTIAALAYCSVCPVRAECQEYADTSGAVGVWGGQHRGGVAV